MTKAGAGKHGFISNDVSIPRRSPPSQYALSAMSPLMTGDSAQKVVTTTANTLLITAIVEMVLHLAVMLCRPIVLLRRGLHPCACRGILMYSRIVPQPVQRVLPRDACDRGRAASGSRGLGGYKPRRR